jgi:hypothetical protein
MINLQSKPILFAEDSSIIISHLETDYFKNCLNGVSGNLNKWFKAHKLTLNCDKTNVMIFCTNSKTCINLNIRYDNKIILFYSTGLLSSTQINWVHLCSDSFLWNDVFIDIWWSYCEYDCLLIQFISVSFQPLLEWWCFANIDEM